VTLVLIGFVGGIITGLSPCVLPVLPVVFLGGGSAGPDAAGPDAELARRRPYLVVAGLTASFAVFTLFGTLILASLHLPDDAIRWLGLGLLVLLGLGLLVPPLGHLIERPFYRFPQRGLHAGPAAGGFPAPSGRLPRRQRRRDHRLGRRADLQPLGHHPA
jgi:cytochrome c biogenesis protein CcdA